MKRLLLLVTLLLAAFGSVSAQDEEQLPLCTEDQLTEINIWIDDDARYLSTVVADTGGHTYDKLDDAGIVQRRYWRRIADADFACQELYTRGFRFGRLIDEYVVAVGYANAYIVATSIGEDRMAGRLEDQMYKHLREYQRLIADGFPEYLDLLGEEKWQ